MVPVVLEEETTELEGKAPPEAADRQCLVLVGNIGPHEHWRRKSLQELRDASLGIRGIQKKLRDSGNNQCHPTSVSNHNTVGENWSTDFPSPRTEGRLRKVEKTRVAAVN